MIIGLTGKSCSGKNYVGTLLKSKGFEVWDLDREAESVRKLKSREVELALGTSDARLIRDIVFNDQSKLRALEAIIYPVLAEKVSSCKRDIVINGATIFRSNLDKLCSFIIYVDAPFEERQKRALSRDGISKEVFLKREESQNDVDFRVVQYRCPVYVLENSTNDVSSDLDKILARL